MELLSNEDEAYGCRVGKYNVILTNMTVVHTSSMHNAMLASVLVLL